MVRGMGMFTAENQMKELGYRTVNNAMKGVVV